MKFLIAGMLLCFAAAAEPVVDEVIGITPVWTGHPVGFCLVTHPPDQFAAFYDADRRMVTAQRKLDAAAWTFQVLPENIGWDSHNYITMVIDDDGYIHLSGNMHVDPLVYFRTEKPRDITTFKRIPSMTGELEDRTTYPRFFHDADGRLLFTYRHGKSGDGNQIYNVYDDETQTWQRLLDKPLTDGEGKRNAYLNGPITGPDGRYHLCWVWRETPDCATNHDPSYARSPDLIHWEDSAGNPLELPITLATSDIVDPVPPGGGVINGNCCIGFDLAKRPVVTCHKYDEDGNIQIYNVRREKEGWKVYQLTDWDWRWDFSGGGTIEFKVRVQPVRVQDGDLVQGWRADGRESGTWRLDPETLKPVEKLPAPPPSIPEALRKTQSDFPGMQPRFAFSGGQTEAPGVRYLMRWESLGRHRDRPRKKPWPEPIMLRLYRLRDR
jgi:hypothetical protein